MTRKAKVNTKYKDRLFNYIFGQEENREWTLSLYNAVNDSAYEDASMIEFNTLENYLYMGMKNDTSFIISTILNLYEHQSSYNPNMPIRMLDYVTDLFSKYIEEHHYNRFGSALIPLPTPKLVCFYNGQGEIEDEKILYLSDSFAEESRDEADIKVRVRMLNVNYGRNKKIMQACKPLEEYAWFVDQVRKLEEEYGDIESAVYETINRMPKDYQIRAFLEKNRAKVRNIMKESYNAYSIEKYQEAYRWEGRKEERVNTERERKRADKAEKRLDEAEKRLNEEKQKVEEEKQRAEDAEKEAQKYKELLKKNGIKIE